MNQFYMEMWVSAPLVCAMLPGHFLFSEPTFEQTSFFRRRCRFLYLSMLSFFVCFHLFLFLFSNSSGGAVAARRDRAGAQLDRHSGRPEARPSGAASEPVHGLRDHNDPVQVCTLATLTRNKNSVALLFSL